MKLKFKIADMLTTPIFEEDEGIKMSNYRIVINQIDHTPTVTALFDDEVWSEDVIFLEYKKL